MNFNIRNGQAAKKMREEISTQLDSGKISKKAVKDLLKNYFEGDPACNGCPTGCKEPNECYIDIHLALIGDNGIANLFKKKYVRDGEPHCCGKQLKQLPHKNHYCTVCGNEYP